MREFCCLIGILLAAPQGTEQSPSLSSSQVQQAPAAQAPVFRVSTRLVQVSVVVHDSHGQPVSDLKKEDFTITERGKPQEVRFFSVAAGGSPASPPPPLP